MAFLTDLIILAVISCPFKDICNYVSLNPVKLIHPILSLERDPLEASDSACHRGITTINLSCAEMFADKIRKEGTHVSLNHFTAIPVGDLPSKLLIDLGFEGLAQW